MWYQSDLVLIGLLQLCNRSDNFSSFVHAKNEGAMKRGWGMCGTFKVNNLTYHVRTTLIDI